MQDPIAALAVGIVTGVLAGVLAWQLVSTRSATSGLNLMQHHDTLIVGLLTVSAFVLGLLLAYLILP